MAKSIKMVWGISFSSKDGKNETVLECKDFFLDELKKFFENKNTNYSVEELKQTPLEEKQGTFSCLLCYDTTRKNPFHAIDWNLEMRNKISKLLYDTIYDKCHYMIGDNDLVSDKYIETILNSYNMKYSVVLEKSETFGFV